MTYYYVISAINGTGESANSNQATAIFTFIPLPNPDLQQVEAAIPAGPGATSGLPVGVSLDPATGWITGRAPSEAGDVTVTLSARNAKGEATSKLTLRIGGTICLTPPMGWNSWYVHSEGVSDTPILEIAVAMDSKGLTDHGWCYLNIDDCWMGLREPQTRAIQPNAKFPDMKALVGFVNDKGLKLGIYSTPWMSTYAGYIGGSAPNESGDYSEYFLPESERLNPHQVFGTNDEVITVNQDPLVKQGDRLANKPKEWEIWAKDLADGGKAVALFNLTDKDLVIEVSKSQLGFTGKVRDLWRQKDIGPMGEKFSAMVSSHGVAFVKISPKKI